MSASSDEQFTGKPKAWESRGTQPALLRRVSDDAPIRVSASVKREQTPYAGPNGPCPCSSGRRHKRCCAISTMVLNTRPKGSPTGAAKEGCYAAPLRDCRGKLTREHPVSNAVLKMLASQNNGTLLVANAPWQAAGVSSRLTPGSLASRVLCERHNAALSPLDSLGAELLSYVGAIHRHVREGNEPPAPSATFDGPSLERYALKILAGVTSTGRATVEDWRVPPTIPEAWMPLLWGDAICRAPEGLYYDLAASLSGRTAVARTHVAYGVYGSSEHQILGGLQLVAFGLQFLLLAPGAPPAPPKQPMAFRPIGFRFRARNRMFHLLLSWPRGRRRAALIDVDLRAHGEMTL